MSNLSPDQFGLYPQQHEQLAVSGRRMEWMRPSELQPHADTDIYKDGGQDDHVDRLATSIARRGYRKSDLGIRDHIHLYQGDDVTALVQGNHRVHAMTKIGYDKPVPVVVSDRRTK